MRKPISQAEARRLKKRVKELELADRHRRNRLSSEYPSGVRIASLSLNEVGVAKIDTALKLDHVLAAKLRNSYLYIYAVPANE